MLRVYSRIIELGGSVISLKATGVKYGELAVVYSELGRSLAEVIRINRDTVYLQVFSGSAGISTGSEVRFLRRQMQMSFSENLLGRIFNGSGQPRDVGPDLLENMVEIKTPTVNPARRVIPDTMVRTNIPMIDVFNTLVVSQKLPIFSIAGEPYNQLLCRIALQAEVDIIILGGMGLKYDDFLYFKHELQSSEALSRSIFFIHTASDPTAECLIVPDVSLTVAEKFALQGKKVLVLLTDMTNFADSLKEIAITMEQVPSNRGYPGNLYSQLARRYEKAVDFEGAGSVTILAVTTMPGDDVTHPVPDNTGYITEGQLYLHGGTIDPFGSLSRLKQLVNDRTREDHRELMDAMIRLFAAYRSTLEKQAMGFNLSTWDKKLLRYGEFFEHEIMDLAVNISLEQALDTCWDILSRCFKSEEIGLRTDLIKKSWPQKKVDIQATGQRMVKNLVQSRDQSTALSNLTWTAPQVAIEGEISKDEQKKDGQI